MEQIEKKYKKMYGISGRNSSGKYCGVSFCLSFKRAVEYFIEKYPRFRGFAEIRSEMAEDRGNGMFCANYGSWETIDTFKTTKELKEYTINQAS